jgi:hypothetical protein
VLTGLSQSAVMALTAEQHAQLAAAYERAAADFLLPPEKRAEYAKKADWFRLLAGLAAKNEKRAPRALRCFTRAGKQGAPRLPGTAANRSDRLHGATVAPRLFDGENAVIEVQALTKYVRLWHEADLTRQRLFGQIRSAQRTFLDPMSA